MSHIISLHVRWPALQKEEEESKLEEWGTIELAAIPRVGETLDVERDANYEVITVKAVPYFGIPSPLPPSGNPHTQRKSPSLKIYGEWESEKQW